MTLRFPQCSPLSPPPPPPLTPSPLPRTISSFDDANQILNVFHWFSLSAISLILCLATSAADLFGRNSSALAFNILSSWMLLVVVFDSQCNSTGYSNWTGLSIMLFPVRILIDLIVLSVPMKIYILDNSDLPFSTILLVCFYHYHIVDFDFHWFFFRNKIMLYLRVPSVHEPIFSKMLPCIYVHISVAFSSYN